MATRAVRSFGTRAQTTASAKRLFVEGMDASMAQKEAILEDFLKWSLRIPEPTTGTLDFKRFPLQHELYTKFVLDRDGVVMKGTQVGISALLLRWAMYWPDQQGLTALYCFPTKGDIADFSDLRVKPMIENSRYLKTRVGVHPDDPDNKGMKKIGAGHLVMRGSQNKTALDSVPADVVAFDEYDTLQHKNIPDAERRISSPTSKGLVRRVGVPSIPGTRVHLKFQQSDQRLWHVRCSCKAGLQPVNYWPRFPDPDRDNAFVDEKLRAVVCWQCRRPIDVGDGEWVATYPERPIKGYHVTRLCVPDPSGRTIESIIAASKATLPEQVRVFFNKDLGQPWVAREDQLQPDEVAAAQRDYYMESSYSGPNAVTMGVDVASKRDLNVRISEHLDDNTKRALWIGKVAEFDVLDDLMRRFNVNMAAVDHEPEFRSAMALAGRFPGRVFVVNYSPKQRDVLVLHDEERRASVRRKDAIDAVIEGVRAQRNQLPLNLPDDYTSHLCALVRQREDDADPENNPKTGQEVYGYVSTGPDDFMHAEVYDMVATHVWWIRQTVAEVEKSQGIIEMESRFDYDRVRLSLDDEPGGDFPAADPFLGGDDEDGFVRLDGDYS